MQMGISPLFVAAGMGHLELMRLLLDKGALIDQQNKVSCLSRAFPYHITLYSSAFLRVTSLACAFRLPTSSTS